jgi:hypothetical protein
MTFFYNFARFFQILEKFTEKKQKKKNGGQQNEESVVNSSVIPPVDDSQRALTGDMFFAEFIPCAPLVYSP